MSTQNGWIGVDLDGTLAQYDEWRGIEHIGEPVPLMLARVKAWLAEGRDVRVFTARVSRLLSPPDSPEYEEGVRAEQHIEDWCQKHFGVVLPVQCHKDFGMTELWDDRCVQVIFNTGLRADGQL